VASGLLAVPVTPNQLKQRLQSGEVLYGCWVGLADAYAASVTATAGFDWLLIDGEHAPNDVRSLLAQLSVIDAGESLAILRPPDGNSTTIKQYLDIGARSLLVPMIESAQQAVDVVRATRYPPEGMRGVGAALARASEFGAIKDYVQTANAEILVLLQIESVKGLESVDEILGIDGVDGLFLGPSDLAADMGYVGQPHAPEVQSVIIDVVSRTKAAGKIAGVLAMRDDSVEATRAAGATFIGVGIDVTSLATSLRALATKYVTPQ
jgi:4-hydroxy-2-oxoheptanedioate aldolase